MSHATKGDRPRRIDVHTHLIPPEYVALLATIGIKGTPGREFPKAINRDSFKTLQKDLSLNGEG